MEHSGLLQSPFYGFSHLHSPETDPYQPARSHGPHVTEEAPGHLAEHVGGRGHQVKGTCTPALEKGERSFLGGLYLRVKAQPCPPGTLISGESHILGNPHHLKSDTEKAASVLFGEETTEGK